MLWHFRHMLLIYYDLLPINVLSICCRCAFGFNLNFNRRSTMISIRYNSSLRHRNRNYQYLMNGPTKWYQYAYQCPIIFYRFALASAGAMLSIIVNKRCTVYILLDRACIYIRNTARTIDQYTNYQCPQVAVLPTYLDCAIHMVSVYNSYYPCSRSYLYYEYGRPHRSIH